MSIENTRADLRSIVATVGKSSNYDVDAFVIEFTPIESGKPGFSVQDTAHLTYQPTGVKKSYEIGHAGNGMAELISDLEKRLF